jgi:hypothetical protein
VFEEAETSFVFSNFQIKFEKYLTLDSWTGGFSDFDNYDFIIFVLK